MEWEYNTKNCSSLVSHWKRAWSCGKAKPPETSLSSNAIARLSTTCSTKGASVVSYKNDRPDMSSLPSVALSHRRSCFNYWASTFLIHLKCIHPLYHISWNWFVCSMRLTYHEQTFFSYCEVWRLWTEVSLLWVGNIGSLVANTVGWVLRFCNVFRNSS